MEANYGGVSHTQKVLKPLGDIGFENRRHFTESAGEGAPMNGCQFMEPKDENYLQASWGMFGPGWVKNQVRWKQYGRHDR